MRCVRFCKEYIDREFPDLENGDKIHGMAGKTQHTLCGLANEDDPMFEGKVTCPECINHIKAVQKLKRGLDF
jgi:NADH dehydrogenase/NADH:ubiquinone oxidoreductase subunit G